MASDKGVNPHKRLREAFAKAINEFRIYRRENGGILLPDELCVEGEFARALEDVGLREKYKPSIGPRTPDEWVKHFLKK
jgi:hypothetical protein